MPAAGLIEKSIGEREREGCASSHILALPRPRVCPSPLEWPTVSKPVSPLSLTTAVQHAGFPSGTHSSRLGLPSDSMHNSVHKFKRHVHAAFPQTPLHQECFLIVIVLSLKLYVMFSELPFVPVSSCDDPSHCGSVTRRSRFKTQL